MQISEITCNVTFINQTLKGIQCSEIYVNVKFMIVVSPVYSFYSTQSFIESYTQQQPYYTKVFASFYFLIFSIVKIYKTFTNAWLLGLATSDYIIVSML